MSYTQKSRELFLNTGTRFPPRLIWSMGLIKYACAKVNNDLGLLDNNMAKAIMEASMEVTNGKYDKDVIVDVFQTGSGTGLNMNINEIIAKRASEISGIRIHPNDHVNMSQSSNDVVPTAIRIAAVAEVETKMKPALKTIISSLHNAAEKYMDAVKAGRTHLRDALPVTLGQELAAYDDAFKHSYESISEAMSQVRELPIGGTAVGTGINTHPDFQGLVIRELSKLTGIDFTAANNFRAMRLLTDLAQLSEAIRVAGVHLYRLGQDIRLMFSGPFTAINEIDIPTQAEVAGSSIMPGKTNPVTVEASILAVVQSMGLAEAISIASMLGEFELSMGIPLIGYDIILQIDLLSEAIGKFAKLVVDEIKPNIEIMRRYAETSPALVTLISPLVGYDKAAEIGKMIVNGKTIREALREVGLSDVEINSILDVAKLTRPNIPKESQQKNNSH